MAVAAPSRPLGSLEQLARERHERDWHLAYPFGYREDDAQASSQHPAGLWFDTEAADRAIWFIESLCKHHKGEWAGQPLRLEEWQRDYVIRPIFGWMRADGTRRFRVAWIEIPRKNGKSELGGAVGLVLTIADQEPGAEVYSTATKKDQAKIVHDTATAMVKASPELKRFAKTFRNNIHCERLGSKFEPLGADSNTLDGLNPHGNIVDEVHAHRDRGVWDVMDTGMGARRQPLTFAITTAGIYDPESIGWQMHDYAIKVLQGVFEDESFFAYITAADEDDDWTDPLTWWKANPNLGVSIQEDYLRQQCEKAKHQPSFLNTFLRLHLNRWTQQRERWIMVGQWNNCDTDLTRAAIEARADGWRGRACYGGLDLSTKIDLTTLVLTFLLDDGHYGLLCRFWVPEETIMTRSQKDRVPYDAWARDGWITPTPGNVIDYEFIEAEAKDLAAKFGVQEIAFDPWNATQTSIRLQSTGITMVEMRQGPRSLSEACKEFEKLVVAGKILHGGHPVMRWMVSNVAKREDANGNIAPDKAGSTERIDGVVAAIMGLGRAIVQAPPPPPPSIWVIG